MAVLQAIKTTSSSQNAADLQSVRNLLEPTLMVPTYESVRNFHIASDLLTVAAVWAMERRRRTPLIPVA
jgi:hypothetical protein